MEDTDWRPSPCSSCGKMRDATRNPVCKNKDCDMYENNKTRMMKPKEEKRYILIREGESPIILSGQDELIKSFNSNQNTDGDQYFELGPEVEVKVSISVKTKGAVYRGSDES